jgi:putative protease
MSIEFTIGVDSDVNLIDLKKLGIKSVYCGYLDPDSVQKWPSEFSTLNRRNLKGSFLGKENMKTFLLDAEKNNIDVKVTFNALYVPEQYESILRNISFVSSFNAVKGIIIYDIGLLLKLQKINYNKKIIISTLGTIFNSSSINFFKQLGATEFVLDRQVKTEEIISILNTHKDVKFEIFLLFSNCLFIDGFCSLMHCLEETENNKRYNLNNLIINCELVRRSQQEKTFIIKGDEDKVNKYKDKLSFQYNNMEAGCNLCLLNKLRKYDNVIYKIISRGRYDIIYPKIASQINNLKQKDIDIKAIYKEIFNHECDGRGCYISSKFA